MSREIDFDSPSSGPKPIKSVTKRAKLSTLPSPRAQMTVHLNQIMSQVKSEISRTPTLDDLFTSIAEPSGAEPLTPEKQLLCICLAQGVSTSEAEQLTGLSYSAIASAKRDPNFRRWLLALQLHTGLFSFHSEMQSLLPAALQTLDQILHDGTASASSRLEACKEVFERLFGKVTQPVETTDTTLRDLISRLDAVRPAALGAAKEAQIVPHEPDRTDS